MDPKVGESYDALRGGLDPLQGFRGLAALHVMIYHFYIEWGGWATILPILFIIQSFFRTNFKAYSYTLILGKFIILGIKKALEFSFIKILIFSLSGNFISLFTCTYKNIFNSTI